MECNKKFKLITTALIGLGAAAVTTQVLANQQSDHNVIRIGGLLQTDFFKYSGDNHLSFANGNDFGDGADVRRANIFARGNLDDVWSVQLAINAAAAVNPNNTNFANKTINLLDDSWVGYAGLDPLWFAVGRITPAFGMDAWTSGANTVFMERASMSDLFAPPSGVGIYVEGSSDMFSMAAAAFTPDHNTARGTGFGLYEWNDPWGYTGRVVFNPMREAGYVFHIGGSYNYQDFKNSETFGAFFGSGTEMYNRQGALAVTAVGNTSEAADYAQVYGGELAAAWGPFTAQGEYQKYRMNALAGSSDMDWTGWYAQLAWVITCESKPYDPVMGVFRNVKPSRSTGAWEVAVRYSDLDLSDESSGNWNFSSTTGEMTDWTLGVNWYATDNVKLQANWVNSDADYVGKGANPDLNINAFGLRAQVMF